jgi:hypothetical protein
MEYREHLSRPLSKYFLEGIVRTVFENPSDFHLLFQLIFDEDEKVAWRAAWACTKMSEREPEWFSQEQIRELMSFTLTTTHGGLLRGCMSILQNLPLPNSIPVEFINACFDWMISPKSPIAVQSLSMKMLLRICKIEPDFKPELAAYLENIDSDAYSAGFNSTRKHVLNSLKNK